jgi:hypothetical protein
MGLTWFNGGCIINSDEVEKGHFFYSSNPKYATRKLKLHLEENAYEKNEVSKLRAKSL